MKTKTKTKYGALVNYTNSNLDDITTAIKLGHVLRDTDSNTFVIVGTDYQFMVLTDSEAQALCEQYIKDSLWAFNADCIAQHTKNTVSDQSIEALRKMQFELCEDANGIVEALIDDMDEFISDAIAADGRGHFLSQYDGEENEQDGFYIYRVN